MRWGEVIGLVDLVSQRHCGMSLQHYGMSLRHRRDVAQRSIPRAMRCQATRSRTGCGCARASTFLAGALHGARTIHSGFVDLALSQRCWDVGPTIVYL